MLAELGPGAMIDVSRVAGDGCGAAAGMDADGCRSLCRASSPARMPACLLDEGMARPVPPAPAPRRFASLFNPEVNLMASLEAGHPLLVLAAGVRGIAPVRAALSWTPVLAHAGSRCAPRRAVFA